MKQVAVITGLLVCAAMTATVVVHTARERERTARHEELRVQNEARRRRLESLEQSLAAASKRSDRATSAGAPPPPITATTTPVEPPVQEATPPPFTPEQLRQHDTSLQSGTALVEDAIRTGQCTLTDVTALGAAMHDLTEAERAQLMTRLTVAINDQQVKVDMRRPGQ